MKLVLAALISIFLPLGQHSGGGAIVSPSNLTLPQIIGLDTVGSSVYADTGTWDGSTSTKSCSWHMLDNHGGVLSTSCGSSASPALTLTSGMVSFCSGSTDTACGRLQVDVTAANGAGNSTALSNFVGPVETSLPTLPSPGAGPAPTSLPGYPGNFRENGVPIYPGSVPPPAAPSFTSGTHAWYFDSIAGGTITSGATGHAGSPFKDIGALGTGTFGYGGFTTISTVVNSGGLTTITGTGFGALQGNSQAFIAGVAVSAINTWGATSVTFLTPGGATPTTANTVINVPLFGAAIQPGDSVYVKADPSGASLGSLSLLNEFSTSDGTTTGTVNYTWIGKDPASAPNPVLTTITGNQIAGFLFNGINVEHQSLQPPNYVVETAVSISGSVSDPTHDVVFENGSITGWIGHSNDPWSPSTYPTSGGHSDGTILTASPYVFGVVDNEDPPSFAVTATSGATQVFLTGAILPPVRNYVWSPGYYYQENVPLNTGAAPTNTGIPNGTIIQDINGLTTAVNDGAGATLPGTVLNNGIFLVTGTHHLWLGVAGSWVDQGAAYMTIAPCDTTLDAATGCSTVPLGCDPRIMPAAGCSGSPTWAGTTRALSGEFVTITVRMTIVPSGWWNHIDWDYAPFGFGASGGMGSGSIDPSEPNDVEGNESLSFSHNMVRYVNSQVVFNQMVNSVIADNLMKYRTQDAIQILSSNRIIIAGNFSSDVSFDRGHPDEIQFASSSAGTDAFFYGSVVVDNEFYTSTDTTDQFAGFTQGIGVTDQVYSGSYMADNINFASDNPSGIAGEFNVDVHNDSFFDINAVGGGLKIVSGNKGNLNVPANSLLANNLTNFISRNISVPGVQNSSIAANIQSISGGVATLGAGVTIPVGWDGWTFTSTAPGFPTSVVLNVATGLGYTGSTPPVTASGTFSTAVSGLTVTSITDVSGVGVMTLSSSASLPLGSTITCSAGCTGFPSGVVVRANTTGTSFSVNTGGTFSGSATASGLGANMTITGPGDCSLDANTVTGNLAISVLDLINGTQSNGNSTYCNTANTVGNSAASGIYPDFNSWSPTDYRSGTANPLFTDYSPVPPAALPAPGADKLTSNTCLRNEFDIGTCSPGAVGRLDLRLNASFAPTPTSGIIGNITNEQSIPTSGAIGDAYILASPGFCSNGNPGCGFTVSPGACGTNGANFYANCTFPPGIYKRCATASTFVAPCTTTVGSATMTGYGASASPSFVSGATPFTPGAIGAGGSMGAQKPPANHARQPWTNPPNIGAY